MYNFENDDVWEEAYDNYMEAVFEGLDEDMDEGSYFLDVLLNNM